MLFTVPTENDESRTSEQLHVEPNNNSSNNADDSVEFGLSYRAPAFIDGRVTRPLGAYRPPPPVAQSHVLEEADNRTNSEDKPHVEDVNPPHSAGNKSDDSNTDNTGV